jgi:hypothetical protein
MATARLTKIEQMPEAEREWVIARLRVRPRPTGERLSEEYRIQFQKHLAASTIYSFLKRRLEVERREINERKADYAAMSELIGERGLDNAAQANLWEAVQTMTPGQLILLRQVETSRKSLKLKERELENKTRELELKIQKAEQEKAQEKAAVEEAVNDPKASREEVAQRIRDIFGVSDPGPVAPGNPGAAVSGPLDQG